VCARKRVAHRRGLSTGRRRLRAQGPVPHRNQEELLMPFFPSRWPARWRPMLRVETVVLIVSAWLIATVNGAWWSAVAEGRAWSDPSGWLFMIAVFVALVALHFVLLGALSNRWT